VIKTLKVACSSFAASSMGVSFNYLYKKHDYTGAITCLAISVFLLWLRQVLYEHERGNK
jgi:hypothetical protein